LLDEDPFGVVELLITLWWFPGLEIIRFPGSSTKICSRALYDPNDKKN